MARPKEYTDKQLLDALQKYICNNDNKKINLSELARESNIKLHIWKYFNERTKIIQQYENTPIIANPRHLDFTFVSGEDVVNKYYGNRSSLISAIQDIINTIHELYDKAVIGTQVEEREEKYRQQIEELKAKIRKKDDEIRKINNEIDDLYLSSEDPIRRKQLGLKDNLIELSPERIQALSKKPEEIRKQYKGLFEDSNDEGT